MNDSRIDRLEERMLGGFDEIKTILLGDGLANDGVVNKSNQAMRAVNGLQADMTEYKDKTRVMWQAHKTRRRITWAFMTGAVGTLGAAVWTWLKTGAH